MITHRFIVKDRPITEVHSQRYKQI